MFLKFLKSYRGFKENNYLKELSFMFQCSFRKGYSAQQ